MHLTASVRRIATEATDFDDARRRLDVLLRRAVGYDFGAFSTADPVTGLWTSCYVSGLDAASASERERTIYELEMTGDVNTFAELSERDVPVATLHAATDGQVSRAKRWAPLLEPYGVVDEVRAVLRSKGRTWGALVLYRAGRAEPFSSVDVAMLSAVVPSVATLFQLGLTRIALTPPAEPPVIPGAFAVTRDGSLVRMSDAAREWLGALDDRGRVPAAVQSLAVRVRHSAATSAISVPCRLGGYLTLYGSPVADSDEIAIVIDAARATTISDVVAHAYRLTDRERQVAALAARGASTREMAHDLGISAFTVGDHLKSLYAKLDVTSRGELVAVLDQRSRSRTQSSSPRVHLRYLDHNTVG